MAPQVVAVRLASGLSLLVMGSALARGGSEGSPGTDAVRVVDLALRQEQTMVTVHVGETLRVHLFEDTIETPLTWKLAPLVGLPPALTLLNTQRTAEGERGPAMLRFDVTYTFKAGVAGTTARLLFVQDSAALNEEVRHLFPPVLRSLTVKVVR
ncbi:hypothetical protein K7W42_06990 [Deinococcus sp. HMF7604]|uniref:hypothetical protein n=1 Tax=Deinococcus betulae TaxID=2873312 RepID=UPI001CCDE8C9|nr:hypothetical protein [Deinococcus betulae]MBZ9750604.1 hypothetical protein [Deinococcus betulae]